MATRRKAPRSARGSATLAAPAALPATGDLDDTPDLDPTGDLEPTPGLEATGSLAFAALAAKGAAAAPIAQATGAQIIALARRHIGERYVLGARAPMGNAAWTGPWDCAEFASWCVVQASGVLFGTQPSNDPMLADAYTGYWAREAIAGGHAIAVEDAAAIAGAAVLRKPAPGRFGHIVLSDGQGGTVEAHSSTRGVISGMLGGRRWDMGILVPGVRYTRAEAAPSLAPPPPVLRLTTPLMAGATVKQLQARLNELGFSAGDNDGIYGPQTAQAVRMFQARRGLVVDGEAGPLTLAALGIQAP